MMKLGKVLEERLTEACETLTETEFARTGHHLEAEVSAVRIRDFAQILMDAEYFLVFVSAVDVEPAPRVIYQFDHFTSPCRIKATVPVDGDGAVPTISDIFTGADWHERETRDLLGVTFTDHPNLIPLLLCEEDVDLKPLAKSEKALKTMEMVTRGYKAKKAAAKKPKEKKS